MAPILKFYHVPFFWYFVLTLITGFFFGIVLAISGFYDTKKLTGVFFFDDMAVLKVMFSAIVVASIGLYLLVDLGTLDLTRLYIPKTYWISQLVGGLLFGIGFMLSGYCPGTSFVSLAYGSLDALFVILGMIFGMWVFGFGYKLWKGLYLAGYLGRITLDRLFGINRWIVIGAVFVIAVFAFIQIEIFEQKKKS